MHPKRRPLIAGNWKMNKGGAAGIELAQEIIAMRKEVSHVDILIAPPYTVLAAIAHEIEHHNILLAAQNMHGKPHGAFTGEVSADMLKETGCSWVILGHSERRHVFGEKDADIAIKVGHALDSSLNVCLCVGETLVEREAGKTLEVVRRQFDAVIDALATDPHEEAIAYEPVWAIGTGKTASPQDAEEVHAAIRQWLVEKDRGLAERTRILYGGSVNPGNAESLLGMPNVDGLLIGGASLEIGSFGAIARTAEKLATS
jgi:triosephosphate isomerase (TIM)